MNAFLSLGRWFFAIPFAIFGLLHFMNIDGMSTMVPDYMPAKTVWVILTGLGLVAAAISIVMGKYDKLATTLLAIFLLVMVVMMHLPGATMGSTEIAKTMAMTMLLKDLSLAGAAMMYARSLATDRSVIG